MGNGHHKAGATTPTKKVGLSGVTPSSPSRAPDLLDPREVSRAYRVIGGADGVTIAEIRDFLQRNSKSRVVFARRQKALNIFF